MKRALTIGLAVTALAATLSFVAAGSSKREPAIEAATLPASDILTTLRAIGLNPIGKPVRRGLNYVMHAYDPRGLEVRVVVDAHFGDILSITPARALDTAYAPNYRRGPRIIHVPQPDEDGNDGADVNDRDQPAASDDDDEEEVAPPPRSHTTPDTLGRSDAPPAPVASRPMPSAPPLLAEDQPPRFDSNADQAGKFGPLRDPVVTSSMPPPPGYTPPAALPQPD